MYYDLAVIVDRLAAVHSALCTGLYIMFSRADLYVQQQNIHVCKCLVLLGFVENVFMLDFAHNKMDTANLK